MKGVLSLRRAEQLALPAGRVLNAQQFADEIAGGHVTAKYIRKHFRDVGSKPGKEWLWYEADARAAWEKRMPRRSVA